MRYPFQGFSVSNWDFLMLWSRNCYQTVMLFPTPATKVGLRRLWTWFAV